MLAAPRVLHFIIFACFIVWVRVSMERQSSMRLIFLGDLPSWWEIDLMMMSMQVDNRARTGHVIPAAHHSGLQGLALQKCSRTTEYVIHYLDLVGLLSELGGEKKGGRDSKSGPLAPFLPRNWHSMFAWISQTIWKLLMDLCYRKLGNMHSKESLEYNHIFEIQLLRTTGLGTKVVVKAARDLGLAIGVPSLSLRNQNRELKLVRMS